MAIYRVRAEHGADIHEQRDQSAANGDEAVQALLLVGEEHTFPVTETLDCELLFSAFEMTA